MIPLYVKIQLLLSDKISRRTYARKMAILGCFTILAIVAAMTLPTILALPLFFVLGFFFLLAQSQRLNDIGLSRYYVFLGCIPLIGLIGILSLFFIPSNYYSHDNA